AVAERWRRVLIDGGLGTPCPGAAASLARPVPPASSGWPDLARLPFDPVRGARAWVWQAAALAAWDALADDLEALDRADGAMAALAAFHEACQAAGVALARADAERAWSAYPPRIRPRAEELEGLRDLARRGTARPP